MWLQRFRERYSDATPRQRLYGSLAAGVAAGFLLLPALIFLAGITLLGPYEGASLPRQYGSVYRGLFQGSLASWLVVLGPALLMLLARGLRHWWRRSAGWA